MPACPHAWKLLMYSITYKFNNVLIMTSSKRHFCYDDYNCRNAVFHFYKVMLIHLKGTFATNAHIIYSRLKRHKNIKIGSEYVTYLPPNKDSRFYGSQRISVSKLYRKTLESLQIEARGIAPSVALFTFTAFLSFSIQEFPIIAYPRKAQILRSTRSMKVLQTFNDFIYNVSLLYISSSKSPSLKPAHFCKQLKTILMAQPS